MYYVIQENVFKESHFELLMSFLTKYDLGHEIVPWRPFETSEIKLKVDRKDIWCWGSVNLSKIANNHGWVPGSMYNANHDLEVYGKHYGLHMLNHDGIILPISEKIPEKYQYFFARPTLDTKSFSGQCFEAREWERWIEECMLNDSTDTFLKDTKVLIAPLKNTEQEIRCWIVKGKVISISRYKLGSRVSYANYDREYPLRQFAQDMADLYCPADAFVLDVCYHNGVFKVVEVNCINCSGFYHVDMHNLMKAIEEGFSN